MTNSAPPIIPYQGPAPIPPNFGVRAAMASWLAPLAAVLLFAVATAFNNWLLGVVLGAGALLLIIGLVSSVVALAAMRRYGRNRILRPAIIGLCLTLVLLLSLGFFAMAVMDGLAGAVR
jgi:hypothetical protein